MLTVTFPSESVCFADNPIPITVRTTLSKSLLKIVMKVTGGVGSNVGGFEYEQNFEFSLTPSGANVDMQFNAMSAAQTMMKYITHTPVVVDPDTELTAIAPGTVQRTRMAWLKIWFYEEYVENGEVFPGAAPEYTEVSADAAATLSILPGGLTDYERFARVAEGALPVESFFNGKTVAFLTRKPAGEVVPLGETVACHFISAHQTVYEAYNGSRQIYMPTQANAYLPMLVTSPASAAGLLTFSVRPQGESASAAVHTPQFYVEDLLGRTYFALQFINGFGVLESAFCYPLETVEYAIESTEYNRVTDLAATADIRRRMVHKTKPSGSLALSSGFVSEEWADWFVNEVMATEQAYIRLNNVWLPCLILPDEEISVRNRESPSLVHVPFTVKFAFNGSINTSY